MSGEEVIRIFPAKVCLFPRVTPRMVMELAEMQSWPRAERVKWTRHMMYPRHLTSLSEAERRRDPECYMSYREALGPHCPSRFPVLAKDLGKRDLTQMSFGEALRMIHYRGLTWHQPLDGDGRDARRYLF